MDEDLRTVATMLAASEPTADAIDRSRRRLRERMRRPSRRTARWATGVGLTAAAAASAIVVTVVVAAPPADRPARHGTPTHAAPMSGRQVLLAAATGAERTPATSGTYWHVNMVIADGRGQVANRSDTWTSRDGTESWKRDVTTGYRIVRRPTPVRYRVALREMTAAQLEKLPTDPVRLRAWMAYAAAHSDIETPDGPPNRYMQRDAVVHSLAALLSGLPAPPKVRAAAFRALASFPGVVSLGPVDGGQAIRFPAVVALPGQEPRMVIDPATGQVGNTNFFTGGDGAEHWVKSGSKATIVGEWTNARPR